jgi:UDP-2,3-diacylglucosamine hydrolase
MSLAYFVSDLHLLSSDDANARVFLKFLHGLKHKRTPQTTASEKPTHLFLVGDIFDLWIGGHSYFRHRFADIIEVIQELVQLGVKIHYFEGNHDLHLADFWEGEVGVEVHTDAEYFEIGGITVRVEHGDLINPDDRGYLFLRRFLRTPTMKVLATSLPASFVRMIGDRASQVSRKSSSGARANAAEDIRSLIRKHAQACFSEHEFDLIISGHVHIKDDFTFESHARRVRAINLGSWFDGPKAFRLIGKVGEFVEL